MKNIFANIFGTITAISIVALGVLALIFAVDALAIGLFDINLHVNSYRMLSSLIGFILLGLISGFIMSALMEETK